MAFQEAVLSTTEAIQTNLSERPDTAAAVDLLRFTTAGSVDDGKSTLIGRLLYDSKAIFEDQLEAVDQASQERGDEDAGE